MASERHRRTPHRSPRRRSSRRRRPRTLPSSPWNFKNNQPKQPKFAVHNNGNHRIIIISISIITYHIRIIFLKKAFIPASYSSSRHSQQPQPVPWHWLKEWLQFEGVEKCYIKIWILSFFEKILLCCFEQRATATSVFCMLAVRREVKNICRVRLRSLLFFLCQVLAI